MFQCRADCQGGGRGHAMPMGAIFVNLLVRDIQGGGVTRRALFQAA